MKKLLCIVGCIILVGCSSSNDHSSSPVLALNIVGGNMQNPDFLGHATSVAVQVHQLSETGKFDSADVYSFLGGNETPALSSDSFGSSAQYIVSPGQTESEEISLVPGVTSVGVVVMFRNINESVWKLTAPVSSNGTTEITLHINGLKASITSDSDNKNRKKSKQGISSFL